MDKVSQRRLCLQWEAAMRGAPHRKRRMNETELGLVSLSTQGGDRCEDRRVVNEIQ